LQVKRWAPDVHLAPDYNIAPSTFQPIIRSSPEDGEREIVLMRWGLIPAKASDPDAFKIFSTTNARAETILEKPIWKGPFQHSRCLVLLDGFYEGCKGPVFRSRLRSSLVFGDIAAPAKPAAKPKAGSRPVYKFEMPDGAPYALRGIVL
jgi:putative SOS response-associated peptidase YedK